MSPADVLPVADAVARGYARRYPWMGGDDLAQEARAAVLAALRTFDGSRGVPLTAYARRAAARALWGHVNAARSPVSNRHRPGDLATVPLALDVTALPLASDGVRAAEVADLAARVRALLAPWEWAVLVAGAAPCDAAHALGLPVEQVYAALAAARLRLRRDPGLAAHAHRAHRA